MRVAGALQSRLRLFGQFFLTAKWTPAGRLIHGAADGSLIPARGERPGGEAEFYAAAFAKCVPSMNLRLKYT